MSQVYYRIWIHLLWTTHLRQPFLTKPVRIKLFEKINLISNEKGYQLDSINGVEDHVHCLYSLKPKYSISKVVKDIKGSSSHWINENNICGEYFNWQDGFAAFSVSYKDVPMIRNYINNQEMHHADATLEKELIQLNEYSSLKRN